MGSTEGQLIVVLHRVKFETMQQHMQTLSKTAGSVALGFLGVLPESPKIVYKFTNSQNLRKSKNLGFKMFKKSKLVN